MSMFIKLLAAATALAASAALAQGSAQKYPGLGRAATPAEIQAWDIDVRPDFKGLPPGSGSVAQGAEVFEARCASCHGTFGESNEVFTPLTGGVTKDDIAAGRVAGLMKGGSVPQKTTMMKVATVSTLWDYINRAMPWNAPKSLSADEVYAVLAYILSQDGIIPEDFTLSDKNMAEVQKRMPNRNGMTLNHGMWTAGGRADVKNVACMKNCTTQIKIESVLPDYARNAHGNLKEQNRIVGPVRGVDTTKPAGAAPTSGATSAAAAAAVASPAELLKKNNCVACHASANKLVGPSWKEVASKYTGNADAETVLTAKVRQGGSGAWGQIPMPPHGHVADNEIQAMVRYVLQSR